MLAGQERTSRASADGGTCVSRGELQAFGGELVYVRGADLLLAVAAEVAITEVIGKDEDNVWGGAQLPGRRLRRQ